MQFLSIKTYLASEVIESVLDVFLEEPKGCSGMYLNKQHHEDQGGRSLKLL